jgi:hypothetical protein
MMAENRPCKAVTIDVDYFEIDLRLSIITATSSAELDW